MAQKRFTAGQKLALLLSASTDRRLPAEVRASARAEAEKVEARKERVPGLMAGPFLTEDGLRWARGAVPEPTSALFPDVVADLLRRLRGAGRPCSGVTLTPWTSPDGRPGYRLRWEGEGFEDFSRGARDREPARARRTELQDAALRCGLVLEDEPDGETAAVLGLTWAVRPEEREVPEDPPAPEPEGEDAPEIDPDEVLLTGFEGRLDRILRSWDRESPGISLRREPGEPIFIF